MFVDFVHDCSGFQAESLERLLSAFQAESVFRVDPGRRRKASLPWAEFSQAVGLKA